MKCHFSSEEKDTQFFFLVTKVLFGRGLVIFLLLLSSHGYAALSGVYSINPSLAASSGNYLTIKSAISDMVSGTRADGGTPNGSGVNGAVVFELASTYTSSGETFPLTCGNVSGASSTNTITFRPASGVSSALTIISSNTTATIDLNGGKYFYFDGRPGGTGSNKYLVISNTSTSGTALRMINEAQRNRISYCTLRGVNTSTTSGVVLISTTSASSAAGNDYNTIDYCDIRDGASVPANGIYAAGTTNADNDYVTISNCNIYNFANGTGSSSGILVGSNNAYWTITGNHLYQEATRITSAGVTQYGIQINATTGNGFTISDNFIGGGAASCGGTAWTLNGSNTTTFIALGLSVASTSATSVQNNTIRNFSMSVANNSTYPGIWCGIYVNAGKNNIGTVTGNNIGNASGTGSVSVNTSLAGGITCGIFITYGADVTNIVNNNIGSFTLSCSTTSLSHGFIGINSNTNSTVTISSNTIGSTTTANSIQAATAVSSTNPQAVCAIYNAGTGVFNATNNTIANLSNAQTSTAASSFYAGVVKGIVSGSIMLGNSPGVNAATCTITGNLIYNLSCAAAYTSSAVEAATVQGIAVKGTTTTVANISGNVIHSLSSTNTTSANVCISGIYFYTTNIANNRTHAVKNNFVHSFSAASSGVAVFRGITLGVCSTTTVSNNMIRLGIDASGNNVTSGYDIIGLYEQNTAVSQYHNSVYVGGSSVSGSQATYAFKSLVSSGTREYQNNIFVNNRSNGSGTGTHYAMEIASVSGLTCGYNLFYTSGTGGVLLRYSSDYTTLTAWRQATGFDITSGNADPNFISPTGTASTVNLHVTGTTPAEGAGISILSVATDYDNESRSGLNPTDIGADAGAFTNLDVYVPQLSYTPFSANTSTTSNRSISVTITDVGTGLSTSGSNRPRIWYRRSAPSTSSWGSTPATLSSGSATNGVWTFTIDYSVLGISPASGETYQYYFVAQDQASSPQVAFHPFSGCAHSDVNTQGSAPSSPNSYSIVSTGLGTSISVGTGQTYTSLSGSGGLFAAINSGALTGNTTVSITSDLSENGSVVLTNAGLNGYTLTIQPGTASTYVISNGSNITVPLISFNGASGVTIDGRSGGSGKYLRFVNTNTSSSNTNATFSIYGGCTGIVIRNCIIENNGLNALGTVQMLTGNNHLTLKACDVRDAQGTPGTSGVPSTAVYVGSGTNTLVAGGSSASDGNNIFNHHYYGISFNLAAGYSGASVISNNNFYHTAFRVNTISEVYIGANSGGNYTISNNSFYTVGATVAYLIAINCQSYGDNFVINNNSFGGSDASRGGTAMSANTLHGILLYAGENVTSNIQGNTFGNIASVGFSGIVISEGNVNVGTTAANTIGGSVTNAISMSSSSSSSGIGIYGAGTVICENNTIANITKSSGSASAYVAGISVWSSGTFTVRNNTIRDIASQGANTNLATAANPVGISVNSGSAVSGTIESNTIYNIYHYSTSASAFIAEGMRIIAASDGVVIKRNRIYNILADGLGTAGSAPYIIGISSTGGSATYINNQISLGSTVGNETRAYGFYVNGSGNENFYYNSVYIGGVMSGSNPCASFFRGYSASGANLIRNNIFYNGRVWGTGDMYAILNGNLSGWTSGVSNYNLFISTSASTIGYYNFTSNKTFNGWQTASGGDASSLTALSTTVPATSLFNDPANGDLSIKTSDTACWYVNGRGVQVAGQSEDFGSTTAGRPVSVTAGAPDIGSDEFTPSVNPPYLTLSGSHTNNGTETFSFGGRTAATITWSASGTLPSLSNYKFWSGTWPNDTTNNGQVSGAKFCNAYWDITATGGSGFSYNLTLYYDDALLGTLTNESQMVMAKKQNGVQGTWVLPTSTLNTVSNTLSAAALTSFSEFTGTSSLTPLPVRWLVFNGYREDNAVQLVWSTASETNNSHFEVERSADGRNFVYAGQVDGHGTTSSVNTYHFTDTDPFGANTVLYYRLRQVDFNGQSEYSELRLVERDTYLSQQTMQVNPNPFTTEVILTLNSKEPASVLVRDVQGRVWYNENISATQQVLSLQQLPAGIYLLTVTSGEHTEVRKLVKTY